ncbi:phosphatase PAP2 family protein [Allorhizobium terrae]|uniref:Phosphatase PAP2 family protein n=1 Tax=Allorhizobium terrae TaxID=1848972 RepID=A0A4S3ZWP9_9HYPH|nr:phosphatase PAP2 family protein [Allorhizobium terrae]THF50285.1 phosphatase PAP2 family protein [Allorhizobium terrae]
MNAILARFQKPGRCRLLIQQKIDSHILALASLIPLVALVFDAASGAAGHLSDPILMALANTFTRFGECDWCLVVSLVLVLQASATCHLATTIRHRCQALFISSIGIYAFLTILLSGLSANLLKRAIGRARPHAFLDSSPLDFSPFAGSARFESFPSGHATTIGAFCMIAALLAPKYRLPFAITALWLGMTRVMVGAHYPSDVIAGLCFGAGFAWIMARLFARYGLVFRTDEHGSPVLRQKLQNREATSWHSPVAAASTAPRANPA